MSTTNYGQLVTASIWSTDLQKYWNNTGNQTCETILPYRVVSLSLIVSIFEFQFIKALLVFYPYEVLALNHEILAYPLVASVPIVSGILQIITYYYSGTLCNAILLKQLVSKLDIVINVKNFIFSTFNFQFVF